MSKNKVMRVGTVLTVTLLVAAFLSITSLGIAKEKLTVWIGGHVV